MRRSLTLLCHSESRKSGGSFHSSIVSGPSPRPVVPWQPEQRSAKTSRATLNSSFEAEPDDSSTSFAAGETDLARSRCSQAPHDTIAANVGRASITKPIGRERPLGVRVPPFAEFAAHPLLCALKNAVLVQLVGAECRLELLEEETSRRRVRRSGCTRKSIQLMA